DVANKSGVADESNASRSMQASPRKVQVSVLTNDAKVIGANVAILIFVVEEMCDKFANTLYGYFIGERLAFPIVEAYVTNAWKKYGLERAICRNGFFFFKFSSHDGMIQTLEGGPWWCEWADKESGDDINLVQLRRNMDKLMDADSVLKLNSNNEKVSIIDTNSVSSANVVVSNNKSAPAEVKVSDKGSLLEQFWKAREASTSKHISSMSDSDESEVEEVCMPDVIPGGGFLDGLEDYLERYDGYKARLYDFFG
nr:hypothetical protein [Tanacetum cinerariifolium]